MRKFIMDKYNLIAFAIGLIPTILLYLFPPDAAVPFWAFSIVLFFLLIAIWMCAKLWFLVFIIFRIIFLSSSYCCQRCMIIAWRCIKTRAKIQIGFTIFQIDSMINYIYC